MQMGMIMISSAAAAAASAAVVLVVAERVTREMSSATISRDTDFNYQDRVKPSATQ